MEGKCPFCDIPCENDQCVYKEKKVAKYSKSKIDKYRTDITHRHYLKNDILELIDGVYVVDLLDKLSNIIIEGNFQWEDGSQVKTEEMYLELDIDYYGHDRETCLDLRASKPIPETDEQVIARLDRFEEQSIIKAEKFRAAREKEESELELYNRLKEKYEAK